MYSSLVIILKKNYFVSRTWFLKLFFPGFLPCIPQYLTASYNQFPLVLSLFLDNLPLAGSLSPCSIPSSFGWTNCCGSFRAHVCWFAGSYLWEWEKIFPSAEAIIWIPFQQSTVFIIFAVVSHLWKLFKTGQEVQGLWRETAIWRDCTDFPLSGNCTK